MPSKSLMGTFRFGDEDDYEDQIYPSFFYNRRQRVSLVSIKSDDIVITHGVLQGSVLDPLICVLHINAFSN